MNPKSSSFRPLFAMFRLPCLTACLLLLTLCCGCGGNKPVTLEGMVTYAGQPLQKGRISFLSPDGNGPTAAAVITDGKYSVPIYRGPKIVKIEGYKVVGQRPYSPGSNIMVDELVPIVPAKYNENSELKAEINGGMKSLDFNLD